MTMEWTMTVNDIFEEEVTQISSSMQPPNFNGDLRTTRAVQDYIAKIIDKLGEESAVAQGLNKTITTAEKLRNNPSHVVYLLKDFRGNDGKGEIIGMLKVGRKHLFLFDMQEQVHEVEPLCVLDFYVVQGRQRMGYGRTLYDYMLHDLEVRAWEMAIDGPSAKMENFLARNFGIDKLMRQNNNFAVAPSFFDRPDHEISNSAGRNIAAVAAAVGRFAAPKPPSAIANVIHGAGHNEASRRSATPDAAGGGGGGEAAVGDAAAAGEEVGRFVPDWENDYSEPSEPELDDDAYEDFYPDQPAAERRDELRALGAYRGYSPPTRYSAPARPASLGVADDDDDQRENVPPADARPANVPAAGMPSGAHSAANSAAGTPSGGRRDSQLTERGYFDVKYYHNKLW